MQKINLILFQLEKTDQMVINLCGMYKNNPDFNLSFAEERDKLIEDLAGAGNGIMIFKVNSKEDLQNAILVIKSQKQAQRKNLFKPVCILPSKNEKVEKILNRYGCLEILMGNNINAKSIGFKLDFWSKPVKQALKKIDQENEAKRRAKELAEKKAKAKLEKQKELKEFELIDPLDLESDIWLFKTKQDYKKVLRKHFFKLIGPSPKVGTWEEVPPQPGDQLPTWRFVEKNPELDDFIKNDGAWFFYGSKPDFDWKIRRWNFTSDLPHLYFYEKSGTVYSRIKFQNNQILIASNSEFATFKEQLYSQSCDNNFTVEGDDENPDIVNSVDGRINPQEVEEGKNLSGGTDNLGGAMVGKGSTESLGAGNLDGKGGTDSYGENPVAGKGGTDSYGDSPLAGKGGTDSYGENPVAGKGGTDSFGDSPLAGKGGTDSYGENPVAGKGGTDSLGGGPLAGQAGTDSYGENPVAGKGGTDSLGGGPLAGQAGTDSYGENPVAGKGGTDSLGGGPLAGQAGTDSYGENPVAGKGGTDSLGGGPLAGQASTDSMGDNPLAGKAPTDELGGGPLAGQASTDTMGENPLGGQIPTDQLGGGPLAGQASTDSMGDNPLAGKAPTDELGGGPLAGQASTDSMGDNPLAGKAPTDELGGGPLAGQASTDSMGDNPLAGKAPTDELGGGPLAGQASTDSMGDNPLAGKAPTDELGGGPLAGQASTDSMGDNPLAGKAPTDELGGGPLAGQSSTDSYGENPLAGDVPTDELGGAPMATPKAAPEPGAFGADPFAANAQLNGEGVNEIDPVQEAIKDLPKDSKGNPVPPVVDANGNPVEPKLDENGNPFPVLDAKGNPIPPVVDAAGNLKPVELDEQGKPKPLLDSKGNPIEPDLDENGNPLPIRLDQLGNKYKPRPKVDKSKTQEALDNLPKDENGNPVPPVFDANGEPVFPELDPNGNAQPLMDVNGNPIAPVVDAQGNPVPVQLDEHGRPIPPVDASGNPIPTHVDQNGNPIPTQLDKDGNAIPPVIDANGKPAVDENGQPVLPHLDKNGQPVLDQNGNPVPTTVDENGNPVPAVLDQNGNPVPAQVDANGQPVMDENGNPVPAHVDANGNPVHPQQAAIGQAGADAITDAINQNEPEIRGNNQGQKEEVVLPDQINANQASGEQAAGEESDIDFDVNLAKPKNAFDIAREKKKENEQQGEPTSTRTSMNNGVVDSQANAKNSQNTPETAAEQKRQEHVQNMEDALGGNNVDGEFGNDQSNVVNFPNLIDGQDEDEDSIPEEINTESGELKVTLTQTTKAGNPIRFICDFEDFYEDELIVHAPKDSLPLNSDVEADVVLNYSGKKVKVHCKGTIIEIEDDEGMKTESLIIELNNIDSKKYENFISLYQDRQTSITDFMKKAKGY